MMMTVTPTGNLTAGGQATISITGGSGSTVTVKIDNGGDKKQTVTITLDDEGNGSVSWAVPATGWPLANFSAEGVTPVTRPIV